MLEPFHIVAALPAAWYATLHDWSGIVAEVFVRRMGGHRHMAKMNCDRACTQAGTGSATLVSGLQAVAYGDESTHSQ